MTTPGTYGLARAGQSQYETNDKHDIELHAPFIATDAITFPIRSSQYAMIELLRGQISTVNNRVYPPGIRADAQFPRITVSALSPTEKRRLGEVWGTGKGRITIHNFKIDCWSKNPAEVDEIADYVNEAIFRNRGFIPSDATKGYFLDCRFKGGSKNTLNPALQAFQRTVNVEAWWLSIEDPVLK